MLRVIGAGVGRTGTNSLKVGLERLLGGPCYHMYEVRHHPEHVPLWLEAVNGATPAWDRIFDGYVAAVDWPASAFWRELSARHPDAIVVLSTRDPESWWDSASSTIFPSIQTQAGTLWYDMVERLLETRFTGEVDDREACLAAYERHNATVRAAIPPSRLVEWHPRDGWGPLCAALDLPVPAEPFPKVNTREEFAHRVAEARRAAEDAEQRSE